MLIKLSTDVFSKSQHHILATHLSKNKSLSFLPNLLIKKLCVDDSITNVSLKLLEIAKQYAVVPISQFNVGAVVFDIDLNAYLGANFEFENTHIGQTIHAEQSAIANAWYLGAKKLKLLAINHPPCGHCRQFINEVSLTDDFKIILPNQASLTLPDYLPLSFGPSDLGIQSKLLAHPIDQTIFLKNLTLQELAITAHKYSYAPYSECKSGLAIRFSDNATVIGCYAENAAFNPSLPALQMALNYRRLNNKNWRDIQQVIMIESQSSKLSQKNNTEDLLNGFNNISIEYQSI